MATPRVVVQLDAYIRSPYVDCACAAYLTLAHPADIGRAIRFGIVDVDLVKKGIHRFRHATTVADSLGTFLTAGLQQQGQYQPQHS
jgi:hypothetical protein